MSSQQNLSLKRTHAILQALSGVPRGKRFEEIRRDIGDPPPATLSRLLKALRAEDWVAHDADSGHYFIGQTLRELAERFLGPGARALIAQACRSLAEETGHSALYCQLQTGPKGDNMVRLLAHQQPDGMHYGPMHKLDFLLAMGFGIPLLAALDQARRERVLAEHKARSGEDPAEIQRFLPRLQHQGVICRPERLADNPLGCTRIVAPVAVEPPGAMGITVYGREDNGLTPQFLDDNARLVRGAARALAKTLNKTQL